MATIVSPQHSAFLSAVLRFLTLHYGRSPIATPEYNALRSQLADVPLGTLRPEWEQRSYWRMPFPKMQAFVRDQGIDTPCDLLDLSGMGARISERSGRARLQVEPGRRVMLSLRPARSTLRIEMPVEIVHHDQETGTYGLAFRAAPLVTHRRDTVGHGRKRVTPRRRPEPQPQPQPQIQLELPRLPPELEHAPIVSDPTLPPANDAGDAWLDFNVA